MTDTPADDLKPSFRSDVTVELVKHSAADSDVLWAARVSTAGEQSLEELQQGPGALQGPDQLPDARPARQPVRAQLDDVLHQRPDLRLPRVHRHRVGWSYNEETGRYRELQPVFYVPGPSPASSSSRAARASTSSSRARRSSTS